MARSKSQTNKREFNFPPNNGVFSGWLAVVLGIIGLVWVVMSMHTVVGARVGIGSLLLMAVAYAFLLRPRIKVVDNVLFLVNPLEDVTMPLSIVDKVLVRSTTTVFVGAKKYHGIAVGRKARQMARGANPQPDQIPDLLEEWVYQLVKDAKLEPAAPDAAVRRTPTWWLIVPILVLAVALAVVLFLV